jgi:hypothetical protein
MSERETVVCGLGTLVGIRTTNGHRLLTFDMDDFSLAPLHTGDRVRIARADAASIPRERVEALVYEAIIDAYESGYSRGHNDTVEGCVVPESIAAEEYADEYARAALDALEESNEKP